MFIISRNLDHHELGMMSSLALLCPACREKVKEVKERIVLREIHLRTMELHLSMGSYSVICHPTEVTAPPLPQLGRLVLDLSTPYW